MMMGRATRRRGGDHARYFTSVMFPIFQEQSGSVQWLRLFWRATGFSQCWATAGAQRHHVDRVARSYRGVLAIATRWVFSDHSRIDVV